MPRRQRFRGDEKAARPLNELAEQARRAVLQGEQVGLAQAPAGAARQFIAQIRDEGPAGEPAPGGYMHWVRSVVPEYHIPADGSDPNQGPVEYREPASNEPGYRYLQAANLNAIPPNGQAASIATGTTVLVAFLGRFDGANDVWGFLPGGVSSWYFLKRAGGQDGDANVPPSWTYDVFAFGDDVGTGTPLFTDVAVVNGSRRVAGRRLRARNGTVGEGYFDPIAGVFVLLAAYDEEWRVKACSL